MVERERGGTGIHAGFRSRCPKGRGGSTPPARTGSLVSSHEVGAGAGSVPGGIVEVPVEKIRRAEALGFHSVWTAEAYGADALSPLAYLAGADDTDPLGCAVAQLAARPPATLAMHAMTIDALAGGDRVILGLGVSGPQIVEGWYGQPWGRPSARLREYVDIVRMVLRREPLAYDGEEFAAPLPRPGVDRTGQGAALDPAPEPRHPDLARHRRSGEHRARGRDRRRLAPDGLRRRRPRTCTAHALDAGFATPRSATAAPFEIFSRRATSRSPTTSAAAIDARKPLTAMYVGGMGSATHNYHREAMARRGFPEAAARIHELGWPARATTPSPRFPTSTSSSHCSPGSPARIRRQWVDRRVGDPRRSPACSSAPIPTMSRARRRTRRCARRSRLTRERATSSSSSCA